MAANYTDLLSMAVLPELLYRFHYGKAAIAQFFNKLIYNPIDYEQKPN